MVYFLAQPLADFINNPANIPSSSWKLNFGGIQKSVLSKFLTGSTLTIGMTEFCKPYYRFLVDFSISRKHLTRYMYQIFNFDYISNEISVKNSSQGPYY